MSTVKDDDRTARARIRDAALFCFARDGFSAPLRVIASEAGVSVPLITHHYGTKETLRQVCDDWVLAEYTKEKMSAIANPAAVADALGRMPDMSILAVYMVRCFLDTGPSAKIFFDRFLDRLREVMTASAEAGIVNPALCDEQTLHVIASQSLGNMLVEFALNPPKDPRDFAGAVFTPEVIGVHMELHRQPFFTDSPLVDAYFDQLRTKESHD